MAIDGLGYGVFRSGIRREMTDSDRPGGNAPSGKASGPQGRDDSVDISSEARTLAAGEMDAARREEIIARIESGTYDRPSVAEEVARRILASGDLT